MKCLRVPACFTLALAFCSVLPSHAALISVTGSGIVTPPPAFIGDLDNPLATHQQGFNEKQGVFLIAPLPVDGGAVAAGTTVDSHMIFFNQSGTGSLTTIATWTFSGEILGVMSDVGGLLEAGSSPFLGAPGTAGYPAAGFSSRGMEGDDSYTLMTPTSLRVEMHIAQPGDWIRVITRTPSVPEGGSAAFLLASGLILLTALRRSRLGRQK